MTARKTTRRSKKSKRSKSAEPQKPPPPIRVHVDGTPREWNELRHLLELAFRNIELHRIPRTAAAWCPGLVNYVGSLLYEQPDTMQVVAGPAVWNGTAELLLLILACPLTKGGWRPEPSHRRLAAVLGARVVSAMSEQLPNSYTDVA